MCYFEGCKKGILSIGKAKGLHVMAYRSDIGNALLLCSYLYSAEYVSVNMTHLLCEFVSFFFPHCFFNIYCAFLCYLEGFLLLFYCCKCRNLGLYLPESPCLLRMKGKYSWSFFLFVVAHILSFVNQFVHFEEDPFL